MGLKTLAVCFILLAEGRQENWGINGLLHTYLKQNPEQALWQVGGIMYIPTGAVAGMLRAGPERYQPQQYLKNFTKVYYIEPENVRLNADVLRLFLHFMRKEEQKWAR